MSYKPNLIPEPARVLPDYFKPAKKGHMNKAHPVILWVVAVLFFVLAMILSLEVISRSFMLGSA